MRAKVAGHISGHDLSYPAFGNQRSIPHGYMAFALEVMLQCSGFMMNRRM